MFQSGQTVHSKPRTPEMDAGRHHRAKLGFILMSTDPSAEGDFRDMAPEGVAVHITRLKTDDHTTNETLSRHIEHMADAASRIQPEAQPDVVSYSCTSGSIVIGIDNVLSEIKKGAPWAKPMCLVQGVIDALNELGAKKLVVGTPYLDEINTAGAGTTDASAMYAEVNYDLGGGAALAIEHGDGVGTTGGPDDDIVDGTTIEVSFSF